MARRTSPTIRRRQLATLLRRYRVESGISVKDVADRLLCSQTKISRLETGQRAATLRDVRDLCVMYELDAPTRDWLMRLARESREPGWWQRYDIESDLATYVGLEAAAQTICDFESGVIPGILQIPEYATAVLRVARPAFTADQIKQTVESRLDRQRLLTADDPPEFWAILDEAVLHRSVGGREVMREQLTRIMQLAAASPKVTLQVLPFGIGAHPGTDSTFTVLDFAEPEVPSVVYVEGLIGQIFLEQPVDVSRYKRTFDRLRAMACSPDESLRLIERQI